MLVPTKSSKTFLQARPIVCSTALSCGPRDRHAGCRSVTHNHPALTETCAVLRRGQMSSTQSPQLPWQAISFDALVHHLHRESWSTVTCCWSILVTSAGGAANAAHRSLLRQLTRSGHGQELPHLTRSMQCWGLRPCLLGALQPANSWWLQMARRYWALQGPMR